MKMRIVQRVIAALICSAIVFVLSGCMGPIKETDVRNMPDEVSAVISIGDSQQKVRSILDTPLIDARSLGVEVYRLTGRDIDVPWVPLPLPIPIPGTKAIAFTLVAYDEHGLVKEIAADVWDRFDSDFFYITAGGYSVLNVLDAGYWNKPLGTLLGPALSYEEFVGQVPREGKCALILLNGICPMDIVTLDKSRIAELSYHGEYSRIPYPDRTLPATDGMYCSNQDWPTQTNYFFGTFIRRDINPGSHRLNIRQRWYSTDFETAFECKSGETVYAVLSASTVYGDFWKPNALEGEISISKRPTEKIIKMGALPKHTRLYLPNVFSPIIWHQGTWYLPTATVTEGNQ